MHIDARLTGRRAGKYFCHYNNKGFFLNSCWPMQRWELVNILTITQNVFLMILCLLKKQNYTFIPLFTVQLWILPDSGSDLEGPNCVIVNQTQTLAFDLVMKAHQINYLVITGKRALVSRNNALLYSVIKNEPCCPAITKWFHNLEITEWNKYQPWMLLLSYKGTLVHMDNAWYSKIVIINKI